MLRMITIVFSLFFIWAENTCAVILHVDDDNHTGQQSGSIMAPFRFIQPAIESAVSGDIIKVAAGNYAENIIISDKSIQLLGGFSGTSADNYQNGIAGHFTSQNDSANITRINAEENSAAVTFIYSKASGSSIKGFHISSGFQGILLDNELTWPPLSHITIANNVLEKNGLADTSHTGGGISGEGSELIISGNTFRENLSGRGGAVGLIAHNLTFSHNLVQKNIAHGDHGGGLYIGGNGTISDNIVEQNQVGATDGYGWGGGLIILGSESVFKLHNNIIRHNFAPSVGGGVFIDEGASVTMTNELIYRNRVNETGGAGIYVDGAGSTGFPKSTAFIKNCTIVNNSGGAMMGSGLYVESSDVTISNSIFWGNANDDFHLADEQSTLKIDFTLSQEYYPGAANLVLNPLFVSPETDDYHLASTTGYWDSQTQTWFTSLQHSPAIDAGDPQADFFNEKSNNGFRLNLGAYGNTREASKSANQDDRFGATVTIKANEKQNFLELDSKDNVSLKISLSPAKLDGRQADVWLLQLVAEQIFSFDLETMNFQPGLKTTYQGNLFPFSDFELQVPANTIGNHRFYFLFDDLNNGLIDFTNGHIYYDYIDVNINEN